VSDVPFDELDPPVRALVAVLNELPCVETVGSCGGHEVPISGASLPADSWHVLFQLEPGDRIPRSRFRRGRRGSTSSSSPGT
jgi:hypothetical protein